MIDDDHPDVARRSLARVGVQAQVRRGIDGDDTATPGEHGLGDVGGDNVDAGHRQPQQARRIPRDGDGMRMDLGGAVDPDPAAITAAGGRRRTGPPSAMGFREGSGAVTTAGDSGSSRSSTPWTPMGAQSPRSGAGPCSATATTWSPTTRMR